MKKIVIIGGGPGGYEAALVARAAGADVTVIEATGMGGSAVLTDVVPSKTLIAAAEWLTVAERAEALMAATSSTSNHPNFDGINKRICALASQQSADIAARLTAEGITIIRGRGSVLPNIAPNGRRTVQVEYDDVDAAPHRLHPVVQIEADAVLIATGASPRELPSAKPDGERILTWKQLYALSEIPSHLIVVGSGVTGAEFAGAYSSLGVQVTLVSSRDQVLPGQDHDAARLIEDVFKRRGMTVLSRSRADAARRTDDGVEVELADGRIIHGSHCLMAVGAVPQTRGIGLEEAGVELTPSGHIVVDKVSRTTAPGIYAAGDCTGVLPLASVASMQGRIAMAHILGQMVEPLDVTRVASAIFTAPEIATVGVSQAAIDSGEVDGVATILPIKRNPRAKMRSISDGFIKLFAKKSSRVVIGGVVVAELASEYIFPIAIAVANRLTVDQLSHVFTVYPSISGSITEAARTLHTYVE